MMLNTTIGNTYLSMILMLHAILSVINGEVSWKGCTIIGSQARLLAVVIGFLSTYIYRKFVINTHWTKTTSLGTFILILETLGLGIFLSHLGPIDRSWTKLLLALLVFSISWPTAKEIAKEIDMGDSQE